MQLEGRLNDCVERRAWRCSRFGVSGYGTAQERSASSRRRVWPYFDPDVVLVATLTGNDIADNHPDLRSGTDRAPFYRRR